MVSDIPTERDGKIVNIFYSVHCNRIGPYAGFHHPVRTKQVRGGEHFVPHPCWYCTFLHAGRHFQEFSGDLPSEKKKECEQEGSH
jgi:hypothetical protein